MKRKLISAVKGSVSILLCICIGPMLALGGVSIDIARINAAGSELDSALQLALNSLMSDYNRDLYEMYGLFAITDDEETLEDMAGESLEKSINAYELCQSADSYMRTALKNSFGTFYSDEDSYDGLVNLIYSYCEADKAPASTLANPAVLENQIVEYMKYRGPLVMGKTLLEKFSVLEELDTECEATAAKLKYDSETASADSLARELYNAYMSYCAALEDSVFGADPVPGLEAAADKNSFYASVCALSSEYRDSLKTMKNIFSTEGRDYKDGDGTYGRYLSAYCEFCALCDESTFMEELPLYAEINPDSTVNDIEGENEKNNFARCTELAGWLVSNSETLKTLSALSEAVLYYGKKLSDSERKAIRDAGLDLDEAETSASTITEYIQSYEKQIKILISVFGEYEVKASALCDSLIRDVSDSSRILSEYLESVDSVCEALAEKLEKSAEELSVWNETVKALEDGTMKESYRNEINTGAESLSPDGVYALKQAAESALAFFLQTGDEFPYPDANLYEGTVISYEVFTDEDNVHYPLMSRLDVLYRNSSSEAENSGTLEKLRNLASCFCTEDEDETPQKISEADCLEIFDSIDMLAETAEEILDTAKRLSLDPKSDKALSDSAAEGIGCVSSLLSGLTGLLEAGGENLLCEEYLTGIFSCASDKNQKNSTVPFTGEALFQGYFYGQELEYLLYGFDSASANTSAAYAEIYAMRFALNLVYAYSDTALKSEALELATLIAGWCGFGIPLVQNIIIIAWAAGESAADMTRLLDGKSVAVYKTRENKSLSIPGLLDFISGGLSDSGDDEGVLSLSYRDYLTLFMMIRYPLNKEAILGRCAKLIQINVGSVDPEFNICEAQTVLTLNCYALVETAFTNIIQINECGNKAVSVTDLQNIGSTFHGIERKKTMAY